MTRKVYQTAHNHLRNITELGDMFDLNRDTVRRRLTAHNVQPFRQVKGVNVYIVKEAAAAIVAHEQGD